MHAEVADSCLTSVQLPYLDCVMPLYGRFMGLSSHEIRRALIEMPLRQLCWYSATNNHSASGRDVRVVPEICSRTDTQTHTQTETHRQTRPSQYSGREQSIVMNVLYLCV